MRVGVVGIGLIAASTGNGFAARADGIKILDSETRHFEPPASSPLKSFDLLIQNFSISVDGGDNFGTRTFAQFSTGKMEDLRKFGLVQFIRGCKFTSCQMADGSVQSRVDDVVPSFGELVDFRFHDFVIDSDDVDPLYNSPDPSEGVERLGYYRWNSVPGSFDPATEHYLRDQAPTKPSLYVSDRFGVAYFNDQAKCAHNLSMQFRMCIYGIGDIPLKGQRTQTDFATPIGCLDWSSSWIYDHALGKFQKSADLAPICSL
jgi:hypothetical protein